MGSRFLPRHVEPFDLVVAAEVIPKLLVNFDRDVRCPVVSCLTLAVDEVEDLVIQPVHHRHASRPAHTAGYDALSDSVIDGHSVKSGEHRPGAIREDITDFL